MVGIAPYPGESSFFPEHLIIPFLTLVIFLVILYVLARIKTKSPSKSSKEDNPDPGFGRLDSDFQNNKPDNKNNDDLADKRHDKSALGKVTKVDRENPIGSKHTMGPEIRNAFDLLKTYLEREKKTEDEFKIGDIISLLGLMATIAAALVVPFTELPILDYTISCKPQITSNRNCEFAQSFEILLHNYGVIPAKNVVISVSAENLEFQKPDSSPFLANHLIYNETAQQVQTGKALVEIDALPPRSHTNITIPIKVLQSSSDEVEPKLAAHVRSDESVAYHGSLNLITFYAILSMSYTILAVLLFKEKIQPLKPDNTINYHPFARVGGLIAAGIIAANLFLYLPHLDSGSFLFKVYYYVGWFIVPALIFGLLLGYHISHKDKYPNYKLGFRVYAAIASLFISAMITVNFLYYLPPVDADSPYYPLVRWIGILSVSVNILSIFLIYRFFDLVYLGASSIVTAILLLSLHYFEFKSIAYITFYYVGIITFAVTVTILATKYYHFHNSRMNKKSKIYLAIAISSSLFISAMITVNFLYYLPPVDADSPYYPLVRWIGILSVPVNIVIFGVMLRHLDVIFLGVTGVVAAYLISSLPDFELNTALHTTLYYTGILIVPASIVIVAVHSYKRKRTNFRRPGHRYLAIAISSSLFISAMITVNFLYYLPPVDADSPYYPLVRWIGILSVPAMVMITLAAYYRDYTRTIIISSISVAFAASLLLSLTFD